MAKLYFYYSSMNAGKSTALLQASYNYRERGMKTLVLAPDIDDRYGGGKVTSRIGLESAARTFRHDDDLFRLIRKASDEQELHCVLVDEAQFLTKEQVHQLGEVTDELDIPVLTYGIRTDFQGEPFEGSKYLLSWAEELVEIKTVCRSGRKATMNVRLDADGKRVESGSQIDIGHHYESVARDKFNLLRNSPIRYTPPEDR